jgi:hypothetical protein
VSTAADAAVEAAAALYGAVPTEQVVAATTATLYYFHDPTPADAPVDDAVLAEAKAAVAVVKAMGCTPKEAVAFLIRYGTPIRAYAAALRTETAATGLDVKELLPLTLVEADRRGDLRARLSAFRREVLEHRIRQLEALQAGAVSESAGTPFDPDAVLKVARKHGLVPAPATVPLLGWTVALEGEWVLADDVGGGAEDGPPSPRPGRPLDGPG